MVYFCNELNARMKLIRNVQFSLLIRINNRLREVNFLQRSPGIYDTDISDELGRRYTFQMVKEDIQWKIKGVQSPLWITGSEPQIHEALNKIEDQG